MALQPRCEADLRDRQERGQLRVQTATAFRQQVAAAGLEEAYAATDVVVASTAEFTDQASLVLHLGPSDPPIRVRRFQLDGVAGWGGHGSTDLVLPIGGGLAEPLRRGGAQVLGALLAGQELGLTASGEATALHPRRELDTRLGLIIRAVGESHEAAHALGYKVNRIRLGAIMFGGAMAGMGGAYVSLVRVPQWVDGITSGAGWIALAIVVFASWKPWRAMIGAYLFGGITVLQLNLQAAGSWIPVEYLSMSPYLITIVVLVIMSSGKGKASLNAPAALGQNFHASR